MYYIKILLKLIQKILSKMEASALRENGETSIGFDME